MESALIRIQLPSASLPSWQDVRPRIALRQSLEEEHARNGILYLVQAIGTPAVRYSHFDSEQCGLTIDWLAEPHDCFDGTRRDTQSQEQLTIVWRRVVFTTRGFWGKWKLPDNQLEAVIVIVASTFTTW